MQHTQILYKQTFFCQLFGPEAFIEQDEYDNNVHLCHVGLHIVSAVLIISAEVMLWPTST